MKTVEYRDPISATVLWLNKIFKGKVTFCGSFGLAVNGLLNRPVQDIDCITDRCYFGEDPWEFLGEEHEKFYTISSDTSAKFYVDGVLVKVFKLNSPSGIKVDVMYREDLVSRETVKFCGERILVEDPASAIAVKKYYIENWKRMENCTGQSSLKHEQDIEHYEKITHKANDENKTF